MASSVLRRAWFGWANAAGNVPGPPIVRSVAVTGTTVAITFSENLRAAPLLAQFAATVAGVARTINSAVVAGKVLTLTLASATTPGQAVTVGYTKDATATNRLVDTPALEEVPTGQLVNQAAT